MALGAITVTGLTDRTRYDGAVTFTVADAAGFDTSALLDGQPVTVGAPETVMDVSYHELVVSQQPSGSRLVETARFQFIVRNPERISTEDGIPTFTPPPIVDDAPSAFLGGTFELVAPRQVPLNLAFPVVARLRRSDGSPLWLNGTLQTANALPPMRLFRGFGSALAPPFSATPSARTAEARLAGLSASVSIGSDLRAWTPRGGTVVGVEDWGANALVHLTNSLTIPRGAAVRIGTGGVVALDPGVEVVVDGGGLEITATLNDPVLFAPMLTARPWGGIRLTATSGSRVTGTGAIFTGSGADPVWFNTHSGYAVHRREQACVLVDVGAVALLTNCFFVRLAGQAFHLKNGTLGLTDCLVQGATTAGELTGGSFSARRCGFSEFPDTSRNFVDGDNDALYLYPGTGNTYTVEDCVIGVTKDDGVDTGSGHILLRHCWVENCFHEGTSPSTSAHQMDVEDTVFTHCGQGVEQGFGDTTVIATWA